MSNEVFLKYEGTVLEIKEIADDELHKALFSLKSNKSPGCDDISSNIIKAVSREVFSTIKDLCNISLQQGDFSDKLKIATLTPIFKNGDESLPTIYWSISVLPSFQNYLNIICAID